MKYLSFDIHEYSDKGFQLNMLERGAYYTLIFMYLKRVNPLEPEGLSLDFEEFFAETRSKKIAEKKAVITVLQKMFVKTETGYRNYELDEAMLRVVNKSEKARNSVLTRWRGKNNSTQESYERNTNVPIDEAHENGTNVIRTYEPENTNVIPIVKVRVKEKEKGVSTHQRATGEAASVISTELNLDNLNTTAKRDERTRACLSTPAIAFVDFCQILKTEKPTLQLRLAWQQLNPTDSLADEIVQGAIRYVQHHGCDVQALSFLKKKMWLDTQ